MVENNGEKDVIILFSDLGMEENKEKNWVLDSRCNNHMCDDKNIFADFVESFRSFVKFGNNERVSMLGKGKFMITLKNGKSNFFLWCFLCIEPLS